MSSATISRRPPTPLGDLREYVELAPSALKVDRENGIIYGVKVAGWQSKNGYAYDPDGVDEKLYEGVGVNIDHELARELKCDPVLGELRNCTKTKSGIYGDLHYLREHPFSNRLCEAAERMPRRYGMSQVVPKGDYDFDRDRQLVTKVRRVDSVDLVAKPATTNGLFESEHMSKKFRDLLESKKDNPLAVALLEAIGDMGDVPVPDDTTGAAAGDYKADLLAAVAKLLDDQSPEAQSMVTKIMAMLKPKPAADATVTEEDAKTTPTDDKKKEDAAASTVGALCEALGMSAVQRKAFAGLTEQADRQTYLTEFKSAAAKLNATRQTPRSQERGAGAGDPNDGLHESQKVPADAKDLAEWLRD